MAYEIVKFIKSKNDSDSLTESTNMPSRVYLTSDTHEIIRNGKYYGGAVKAHYYRENTHGTDSYYKININSEVQWMLAFTIRVYQYYYYYDIVVCGYNYSTYHWHNPSVAMLGASKGISSSNIDSITVTFGYDGTSQLWVAIPANDYTGIDIINCCNGFKQTGLKEKELFTITPVSSLSGTTQTTITAHRPIYNNEIFAWAKASTKPSYSWGEISDTPTELPANGGNSDTVNNFNIDAGFTWKQKKSVTMTTCRVPWYVKIVLNNYSQPDHIYVYSYYNNEIDRMLIEFSGMSKGYILRNNNQNTGNIKGVWFQSVSVSGENKWVFWLKFDQIRDIDYYSISTSATIDVYTDAPDANFAVTATATEPSGAEWDETGEKIKNILIKNATLLGNASSADAVPWSGITDKPSTFTPSAHTHTMSNVTDLPQWITTTATKIPATKLPAEADDFREIGNVIVHTVDSVAYYFKYGTPATEVKKGAEADPSYVKTPEQGKMYLVNSPYVSGPTNALYHGVYNSSTGLVTFELATSDPNNNGSIAILGALYLDIDANKFYRCYNASSANVSFVASSNESDIRWGGKNISNGFSPIDAALYSNLGNNFAAFMPANCISVEYSRDAGATWSDYEAGNESKVRLFSNISGTSYIIGKNDVTGVNYKNYQLRVTLTTYIQNVGHLYSILNKFIIYVSTNGSSNCWCSIFARKQEDVTNNNDVWTNFADTIEIGGWSGYNVINTSGINTFSGNASQASTQYGQIRFVFGCTTANTSYKGLQVLNISCYGGVGWTVPSNMAKYGHVYSLDYVQKATFPNYVQAVGFGKTNSNDNYVLLGGGGHKALSELDTKVTQTKTGSSNTSPRPLLLGYSYSDDSTFNPSTTTNTTYASHLAKFAPSTGILSVVGLTKMKTDGTMDTASNTKVWNTNGGVSDLPTVNNATLTIQKNGVTIDTFTANASANKTINISVPKPHPNLVKSTTSPGRLQEKWAVTDSHTPNECNIYEVVSAIESDGKLTNVSGKAIYLLDARVISWKGKSIPVSAARDGKTKKWKITIPSDYTSSTITSCYCYVKFVYDNSSSGSPSLDSSEG